MISGVYLFGSDYCLSHSVVRPPGKLIYTKNPRNYKGRGMSFNVYLWRETIY